MSIEGYWLGLGKHTFPFLQRADESDVSYDNVPADDVAEVLESGDNVEGDGGEDVATAGNNIVSVKISDAIISLTAKMAREEFVRSGKQLSLRTVHIIEVNRSSIFDDVLRLYSTSPELAHNFPLRVN